MVHVSINVFFSLYNVCIRDMFFYNNLLFTFASLLSLLRRWNNVILQVATCQDSPSLAANLWPCYWQQEGWSIVRILIFFVSLDVLERL